MVKTTKGAKSNVIKYVDSNIVEYTESNIIKYTQSNIIKYVQSNTATSEVYSFAALREKSQQRCNEINLEYSERERESEIVREFSARKLHLNGIDRYASTYFKAFLTVEGRKKFKNRLFLLVNSTDYL